MRLVTRAAFAVALALTVTALSAASFAQGGVGLANGACREDVDRLCADAKGKRGAVPKCLHEKIAELDPDCRLELENRDARLTERVAIAQSSCGPELDKFCAGKADYDKVPCLREHHGELSEGCRAVIPEPRDDD